ncbi:hypothetical protein Egran_03472 [Elaphomyces granulatus]|uniref:DUF1740-domain-containing protein n=1 Tax=Elaphomyces granulatus TaxID=519963 RepID=A0A232LXE2_9EURO|nr:hypothetical protein Egran_03472 [Elaphomyces granulatus]
MDLDDSEGKKFVPKFTSFKPKAQSSLEHFERHKDRGTTNQEKEWSKHRNRRYKQRSKKHSKDGQQQPGTDSHASTEQNVLPRETGAPRSEERGDLYLVDRKGDAHNVTYGTIHRYNVPLYHRVGRGRVLGLPPNYSIDRVSKDEAALVVRSDAWHRDGDGKSKSILADIKTPGNRLLHVRRETHSEIYETPRDFIPFRADGSRKRKSEVIPSDDNSSDTDKIAYRSIEGKAKPNEDLPSDLEAASETGDGGIIDLEGDAKQRNIELSKQVEDSPTDIDAWIQLIEHQDVLIGRVTAGARQLTSAEERSLADIKLSLYGKALKNNGSHPSKDRLLLGLMEEGSKVWDSVLLSEKWRSTLRSNPGHITLWVKYLNFRQTEFLEFTFERCRAVFLDCMKLNASGRDSRDKATIHTYLFLRMTTFMREAGFVELAVGLWQAVLEFILFRPPEFDRNNDVDGALSSFMEFWESEVARVGEGGAKGWNHGDNAVLEPSSGTLDIQINPPLLFESWLESEKVHEHFARFPARSLDEVDDDPYRVVLYADIKDLLPFFWTLRWSNILLQGFLCFCQLPPLPSLEISDTPRLWSGDSFLRNELIGLPDTTLAKWFEPTSLGAPASAVSPASFPIDNFIHSLDSFFNVEGSWFASFKLWNELASSGSTSTYPDWVRRVLRLLVDAIPADDDLAEYTLALEFACSSKDGKKYAKSLLKKRSSNLRLYNEYALIECRSGNCTAADHVWVTTFSLSSSLPDPKKLEYAAIWRTWLWEALDSRDMQKAIGLLLSIPQYTVDLKSISKISDGRTLSPAEFLKIQKFLSESQERALTDLNFRAFIAFTECLAILLYLAHSSDLDSAIGVFKAASERLHKLPRGTATNFLPFINELSHQARSKFLYHHVITTKTYKPSQIRALLMESIDLFPYNTIFLALFAWNESRFRIDERVRDVLQDILSNNKRAGQTHRQPVPVTSHLFSIYSELHRPAVSGSTRHSVRAAFERAIGDLSTRLETSNSARSNLSIWKLYVLFELSVSDFRRAKEVFYRGMRACPWSKGLIMLAFSHLRRSAGQIIGKDGKRERSQDDGMDFAELRHIYYVLLEKELRIHVDIEDELEKADMVVEREKNEAPGPIYLPDDDDTNVDLR